MFHDSKPIPATSVVGFTTEGSIFAVTADRGEYKIAAYVFAILQNILNSYINRQFPHIPVFYSPPRVPMECSWSAHGVLMECSHQETPKIP
jgi:hypothetical protein